MVGCEKRVALRGQADPDFNRDCSSGLGFQPDQNRKLLEVLMRFDMRGDFSAAPVRASFLRSYQRLQ